MTLIRIAKSRSILMLVDMTIDLISCRRGQKSLQFTRIFDKIEMISIQK